MKKLFLITISILIAISLINCKTTTKVQRDDKELTECKERYNECYERLQITNEQLKLANQGIIDSSALLEAQQEEIKEARKEGFLWGFGGASLLWLLIVFI